MHISSYFMHHQRKNLRMTENRTTVQIPSFDVLHLVALCLLHLLFLISAAEKTKRRKWTEKYQLPHCTSYTTLLQDPCHLPASEMNAMKTKTQTFDAEILLLSTNT